MRPSENGGITTAEGPSDPVKELERQIKIRGVAQNTFKVMKVDETLKIK